MSGLEWFLATIIIIGSLILLVWLNHQASLMPFICPRCKKEIEKTEDWSYGDYSWGSRCPHCKYEFDITP